VILLDTNVLIDAFDPSARLHAWASDLIRDGLLGEGVAINPVILAELYHLASYIVGSLFSK
jgi:predicted nucleic acid-binding protein